MILGDLDLDKIGERLKKTDRFFLDVLMMRLAQGGLSDCVAECKRRKSPDGNFSIRRRKKEKERIELAGKWAEENGINPKTAKRLMRAIISESCRVQADIRDKQLQSPQRRINEKNQDELYEFQRENLLELTKAVARGYDQKYGKGLLGSELYFSFEKKILSGMIAEGLQSNKLAVDLGCATGIMSFEIAHKFKRVIGYDISPDMINVARSKISSETSHVEFVKANIENGIDLPENSVSLAIMNMGTGSDIANIKRVLDDLKKSLEPGGKFFLSFYNSESLLHKIGFVPWPVPLAAHIDTDKRCLEVQHSGKIYFIYARPRSVTEVRGLLSDFEIDNIVTFPTLASIIPNIITESEDGDGARKPNKPVHKLVKEIDTKIAGSDLNCGTYIIVTGGKSAE